MHAPVNHPESQWFSIVSTYESTELVYSYAEIDGKEIVATVWHIRRTRNEISGGQGLGGVLNLGFKA
jgi:hypothetical protein